MFIFENVPSRQCQWQYTLPNTSLTHFLFVTETDTTTGLVTKDDKMELLVELAIQQQATLKLILEKINQLQIPQNGGGLQFTDEDQLKNLPLKSIEELEDF